MLQHLSFLLIRFHPNFKNGLNIFVAINCMLLAIYMFIKHEICWKILVKAQMSKNILNDQSGPGTLTG